MAEEIAHPRPAVSPRAPEIIALTILPEQIGQVIGGGGKTIKSIKDETGVDEITIEDNGQVFITGREGSATKARERIETMTKIYSAGDELDVTIVKLTNFGAFAKLDEYHEGLIHVSEIAPEHTENVSDILHEGQVVPVVVTKVADGKIGLSIAQRDPHWAENHPPTS